MCIAMAFRALTSPSLCMASTIKPALALGGWVALKPMRGQAMVMGDLGITARVGFAMSSLS
jgi:hypothetical protein